MNITIAGIGYVGLSLAVLLAQDNDVTAVDIVQSKVDALNARTSPIKDNDIEEYLREKTLNLKAMTDSLSAYKKADFVIVATPTNYDPVLNYFDTKAVDGVISDATAANTDAIMVIKSTVPVGYTESAKKKFDTDNIIFSPEFSREGQFLYDCLYPSRVIVGEKSKRAELFAELLVKGAIKDDMNVLFTDSAEAEAVKLFASLAFRV